MARKITTIPATLDKNTSKPIGSDVKKRVAGYARVSTDNDDQVNSYEAQVDYYTEYIQNRADWIFVKVYTDDGISGTSTAKREGFKAMIADALAGKIDLIVTKSVSRFARNTVDSLTTIRELKDHGIEVYFEKENIWTFDSSGELLLTIMSSISQEESRSISLNVTWGVRKAMQDGKVHLAFKNFLGFDRGADGSFIVNEEQAKVVRWIFAYFIQGLSAGTIANRLTELGIDTPGGAKAWSCSTVNRILRNEKYKGDALLQKTFTTNYLTKKKKANEGEVPQYYVEGSHPAIIDPVIFDWVQEEIRTRSVGYSGKNVFSSRIVCGECGSAYGRKIWHSGETYKKAIWQCNWKYGANRQRLKGCKTADDVGEANPISRAGHGTADRGGAADVESRAVESVAAVESRADVESAAVENAAAAKKAPSRKGKKWVCPSPSIGEADMERAFVEAVNKLLQGREKAIAAFELAKSTVFDTSELEIDLVTVNAEIRSTSARMKAIGEVSVSPDAYGIMGSLTEGDVDGADGDDDDITYMDVSTSATNEARMAMRVRMEEAKQRQEQLKKAIKTKKIRRTGVDEYVSKLKADHGRVSEFSPELFSTLVDYVTVRKAGTYTKELTFTFLDGTEIRVNA